MRSVPASRSRFLGQAALVVLLAGMSASCSNSLRLGEEPAFTGSTENQRDILGQDGGSAADQPMPAPASGGAVVSSDIPPPAGAGTYAPPPSAPAVESADAGAADGPFVWTAVGGRVITLKAGDSLDTLETKFGVPGAQILAANQMTSGAQLRPGKVLVIPRRVAMGPGVAPLPAIAAAEPAPAAPAPATLKPVAVASAAKGVYVVQPGDTLFSVARKNGSTVATLARLNGIAPTAALTGGQRLKVASAAATLAAAEPKTEPTQLGAPPKPLGTLVMKGETGVPASPEVAAAAPAEPKIRLATPAETAETGTRYAANAPTAGTPAMPTIPVAPQADPAAPTQASVNAADTPSADGKQFRWPVRGRIISGFGSKPNGEKNDGINLAVPAGTSVKAVEAGTVIYSGNELAGYGNLVLVRHVGGWVSAYAHNQDLLVKRGDTVARGQTIAHAGMTGSVTSPQVHFELRMGAKPVNPMDYLAGA